jgi:ABC-type antimicrobial peptide transport system permease subunit
MVFVRTAGDPSALAPHVRAAARRYAPFAPIFDMQTMGQRIGSATAQARFSAVLLGMFAAIALTVAMIGVYGVMAFAVAARTREIGIRMALGAAPARVLALVMREGALLAGLGLTIGVVAALGATRALRTQLFEISTTDPVTYVAMAALLGVALAAACWIPARRAARVDPLLAMRAE